MPSFSVSIVSPHSKFLGLVLPAGEHRVYATTSNTMVKLLCVTRGSPREDRISELLMRALDLYSMQVCSVVFHFFFYAINLLNACC